MPDDMNDLDDLKDKFGRMARKKKERQLVMGSVFDFHHGLTDRGGWINIGPQGQRQQPYAPKPLTEAQIRRLLQIAYNKGWTEVYFTRGGKIDSQATQQARSILMTGMPELKKRMAEENGQRRHAVEEKIHAIQNETRSMRKSLRELHDAGRGQSDDAKAILHRLEQAQSRQDRVTNFYQSGEWQRRFEVSGLLPEEPFAFHGPLARIPALRLGPIILATPFAHAAAFQREQRSIRHSTRVARRQEKRDAMGLWR